MRKIIIGLSGILVAAFVVIMVANAQGNQKEVKKGPATTTEVSKDCSKCPAASGCAMMKETKTAEVTASEAAKCKEMGCDPAKCKEMGCDPAKCKEGKCDPATCKAVAKK
jgi:hypothetical protein